MGLIKALTSSMSSAVGDQFKEYISCPQVKNDIMIQRGTVTHGEGNKKPTEGVISNGSTIAVPQGMAMMLIDGGKIVEFSSEPGVYTWNSSTESSLFTGGLGKGIINTFKTIGSRITYGGQAASDQRVYFINIKEIPGNLFGSKQPETVADPVYGSVEITYNGEYSIKVEDPIILINNVIGANAKDSLSYDEIFKTTGENILKSKFAQMVSEAIADIMYRNNISFTQIQRFKSEVTNKMNDILDEEWMQKYGIQVTDVALRVNASEESRKIVQEMDKEIATTTRMGQAYSGNMAGTMAAASAEAMKGAASNENGSMMGFMGMNFATQQASNLMGSFGNQPNQPVQPVQPNQPSVAVANEDVSKKCTKCQTEVTGKFCPNCGTPTEKKCPKCGEKVEGKFCGNCGEKVEE